MLVDPDRPEVELRCHLHRPTHVLGENRSGESVANVVRHLDRLVVRPERLHGDDRAEDLVLDDLRILGDVGDDRRLDEEAAVAERATAGHDCRLGSGRTLQEAEHALLLLPRDDGPHLDLVVGRGIADGHRLDCLHRLREDVVVDALVHEDPRRGRAVLTGVEVAADLDRLGDRRRVRVVEDDHRRLPAELEMEPLDRVRSVLRDDLAGRRVPGQRDEADVRVPHERVSDGDTVAGDDLEHARWDVFLRELYKPKQGQRRLLGGLDDLDVAGGERRTDLPDRHVQRVVPGADSGDYPERLAPDERGVALDVLARRLALEIASGACEEAKTVRHRRRLVLRDPPRLPDVRGLEPGELFHVLVDDVREREQELHPVLRGLPPPVGPGMLGNFDRALDVLGARAWNLGDRLAGGRVENLHRLAARGLDERTADELLLLHDRDAHTRPPFARNGLSLAPARKRDKPIPGHRTRSSGRTPPRSGFWSWVPAAWALPSPP